MFWFWLYLKPIKATLNIGLKAREATYMWTHIFWKLCIIWVQPVWQPKKNEANPTYITILVITSKNVFSPSILSRRELSGVNLVSYVEAEATSSVFTSFSLLFWSNLAKIRLFAFVFLMLVLTSLGYLQITDIFLPIISLSWFSYLSQYLISSLKVIV